MWVIRVCKLENVTEAVFKQELSLCFYYRLRLLLDRCQPPLIQTINQVDSRLSAVLPVANTAAATTTGRRRCCTTEFVAMATAAASSTATAGRSACLLLRTSAVAGRREGRGVYAAKGPCCSCSYSVVGPAPDEYVIARHSVLRLMCLTLIGRPCRNKFQDLRHHISQSNCKSESTEAVTNPIYYSRL